jgi:hypothetical protein
VSGQGVLAVGFDHRTSREGDPLLHTHLVIANRVQEPDGRWTALDGRDLYRHRLAADAIYRATYQRELVRSLGVEWTAADTHGNRELAGMPEDLVRSFSKRTGQIDASSTGWWRTVESGHRGWSSGPSRPPATQAARDPGHPVRPLASGGGRARRERGHPGPGGDRPDTRPRPGPDSVRGRDRPAVRSAGRPGRAGRARVHLHPPRRAGRPRRRPGRRRTDRAGGAGGSVRGRAGGQCGRRPDA